MKKFKISLFMLLGIFLSCDTETTDIIILVSDFMTTIDENPSAGLSLGNVNATTNQDTLTYSIIEQTPNNAVAVNSATGEITVLNEDLFDFETNPTITGVIKVENGNVSNTANFTINLNDVNETTISVSSFLVTIDENPSAGLSLGTINATTNQGTLTYSIIEQTPNNAVAVNSTTGEITVLNENLFDFETNPTITGVIKVENGNVFNTANFTINLNDVNETTISVSSFLVTIDENPSAGLSLGTINATTNQGTLTYSITEQTPNNAVAVNSTTGEITVLNEDLFDFEINPTITGLIKVENNGTFEFADLVIILNDIKQQDLQQRLDNGETPCEIYQSNNAALNELYGLNYLGGLIFYLNTTNCNGLLAAPNDQSIDAQWGCYQTYIPAAANPNIGSGLTNTNAIIATCNEPEIASRICDNLNLNSFNDWYLPSKNELNLMYVNLHKKGFGNFENGQDNCCNGWYWSSTEGEVNGDAAWVQSFRNNDDGIQATYDIGIKNFKNHVRAIRSF